MSHCLTYKATWIDIVSSLKHHDTGKERLCCSISHYTKGATWIDVVSSLKHPTN